MKNVQFEYVVWGIYEVTFYAKLQAAIPIVEFKLGVKINAKSVSRLINSTMMKTSSYQDSNYKVSLVNYKLTFQNRVNL